MIVTAWILFSFFGLFSLWTSVQYFFGQKTLGLLHALMWFFSVVLTAISAGVIWGGLFSSNIQ